MASAKFVHWSKDSICALNMETLTFIRDWIDRTYSYAYNSEASLSKERHSGSKILREYGWVSFSIFSEDIVRKVTGLPRTT